MPEDERIPKLSGSGVTIDGTKTLEEWLDEEEERQDRENNEARARETRRSIYRGKGPNLRFEVKERSGRTRHLTAREIRREYGIMSKPFETTVENIIWVIMEKHPIKVKEIAKEIGWEKPLNTLSAQIKTVWDRLGTEAQIIDRYKEPGDMAYTYTVREGVSLSTEAAIQKYKVTPDPRYKKKKAEKLLAKEKGMMDAEELNTNGPIERAVAETVSNQLGMKVKVSGRVEVVFRFIVGRD